MDDKLLLLVYRILRRHAPHRGRRVQFGNATILAVYFWSVIRNKPMAWACERANVPSALADRPLPTPSTISRRLRRPDVQHLLDQVERELSELSQSASVLGCWMIDAKPLLVSPYTKDRQARRGWAYNGFARGYKLFALCDADGRIINWQVHAMNRAEPTTAQRLIDAIPQPGYLLGDSIYDSTPLHQAAADRDLQLVAPRKQPGGPIGQRARHPNRLHAIDMLETHVNSFGKALYNQRTMIERVFAQMGSEKVGMDRLPPFVRTLARVRRWVQAKIILYHLQH